MYESLTWKKAWGHFRTVVIHKHEVAKACFKAGLYWQGIMHDLSKFYPSIFFTSCKYYDGNGSPVDNEKREKGYSAGWLKHRGCSPHHWEYWMDGLGRGGIPIKMPIKYVTEMICDFIGAGKAYMGKAWNFTHVPEHTKGALENNLMLLHPKTEELVLAISNDFVKNGYAALKKAHIKALAEAIDYENAPNVDGDLIREIAKGFQNLNSKG